MRKLEKLEAALSKAAARRYEVAGQREQREERLRVAVAEAESARRQRQAKALVPGQDTSEVETQEGQVRELEGKVEKLRGAEAEAAAAVRQAKAALEEESFREAPEAAARAKAADGTYRALLARSEGDLVKWAAKVQKAEVELEAALEELRALTARLRGAGPVRAEQVRELRSHLRNRAPLTDAEVLGFWVVRAIDLLRKDGGTQALLGEAGIPPLPGSVQEGGVAVDRFQLFHQRQLPPINI